jgi:hypothetical protein
MLSHLFLLLSGIFFAIAAASGHQGVATGEFALLGVAFSVALAP